MQPANFIESGVSEDDQFYETLHDCDKEVHDRMFSEHVRMLAQSLEVSAQATRLSRNQKVSSHLQAYQGS